MFVGATSCNENKGKADVESVEGLGGMDWHTLILVAVTATSLAAMPRRASLAPSQCGSRCTCIMRLCNSGNQSWHCGHCSAAGKSGYRRADSACIKNFAAT